MRDSALSGTRMPVEAARQNDALQAGWRGEGQQTGFTLLAGLSEMVRRLSM